MGVGKRWACSPNSVRNTMVSFDHPNVMSLIGMSVDGEIPLLILLFMANGNVLEYVKCKKELFHTNEAAEAQVCHLVMYKGIT